MEGIRTCEAILSGPCRQCGAAVEVPTPIHLTSDRADALSQWPSCTSLSLGCSACGALWPIAPVPCVYWGTEWIGLVVNEPRPAVQVLSFIDSWIIPHIAERTDTPIRVFDSMETFSYDLRHPDCSLYRQDLRHRLTKHWDHEVLALTDVADAALQADLGWLAYMILAGVIQDFPEFFFIPEIRSALELAAFASGDTILPFVTTDKRTAMDEHRKMTAALDPHRPFAELDTFSIWYDSPDMSVDEDAAESANAVNVPQESPSSLDAWKVCLRILAAEGFVKHALTRIDKPIPPMKSGLFEWMLRANWPGFPADVRSDLDAYFEQLTGNNLGVRYGLRV